MALSENMKKLHQGQVELARKYFEEYKNTISAEFIEEFGGSYQTVEECKDTWRKSFIYAPECEDFLKFRTRIFLRVLPNDEKYHNPRFLRELLRLICDYLSIYIVKKDATLNRNDVKNKLFDELFNNNRYIQRKTNDFVSTKNRNWGLEQKTKRERKRIKQKSQEPILLQRTQEQKLQYKQLRIKISLLKAEIKTAAKKR